MAEIHRRIKTNWNADDWKLVGHKKSGVNIYAIYRKGEEIVRDTLLKLDIRGKSI